MTSEEIRNKNDEFAAAMRAAFAAAMRAAGDMEKSSFVLRTATVEIRIEIAAQLAERNERDR